MNRRGFLTTLLGIAIAPAIVVKVITAQPKPKLVPVASNRWPSLKAEEFCRIQPMMEPSSEIFYMKFSYDINPSYYRKIKIEA